MKQKRILIPTDGPKSWKQFLADPEKHWKPDRSAMSTAYSWENAWKKEEGMPREIALLFENAEETRLRDARLVLAIPEYKVELEGGRNSPSCNDVFAILSCSHGLISMTVEGKAEEDFGALLKVWKKTTSPRGVQERMSHIMQNVGLNQPLPDDIRYQLLHRTASAVIEADRFHAPFAVVIVQSFVGDDTVNHYEDFCKFIRLFTKTPVKEKLIEISNPHRRRLFAAWVQSKPEAREETKIMLIKLVIDRFEDKYAILESQGKDHLIFNFPHYLLPEGAKEGDVISINIDIDNKETEIRRKKIKEQLDNLKKKDQGGDIQL